MVATMTHFCGLYNNDTVNHFPSHVDVILLPKEFDEQADFPRIY